MTGFKKESLAVIYPLIGTFVKNSIRDKLAKLVIENKDFPNKINDSSVYIYYYLRGKFPRAQNYTYV